jgi:hypothetical protein
MTANHLDPASFAWGLAIGTTFGAWLRGLLDRAFAEGRTVRGRQLLCPPRNVLAQCSGPCEQGFQHCDCGLLQKLNPHLRPPKGLHQRFIPNPVQVAECGGPCQLDPLACDCWLGKELTNA